MECAHGPCQNEVPEGRDKYCSKRCYRRAKHNRYVKKQIKLGTDFGQWREAMRNQHEELED